MAGTQPEVVTFGETMVVMVPETTGPLRYVQSFGRSIGGAESNVAIGLVRLGHSAGWISRLGRDELGLIVLQTIRGEGVDVSRVTWDDAAPTGLMFKERSALGETRVTYFRSGSAASRLSADDLDLSYVRGARMLHVTGITPALSQTCAEASLNAMRQARAAGVTVSFDPNMRHKLWSEERARPVFRHMASLADIVLPGLDEAQLITGEREPEAAARAILELGAKMAVLKLGPEGALVATAESTVPVAGTPLTPVDTVGAGDAFAAGLLAGLLDGLDPVVAAEQACAAGALATQATGDWEAVPGPEELAEFMGRRRRITR